MAEPFKERSLAYVYEDELTRLRAIEAAARALVAEPWKSAAGKPSRADLTAALRESLR